MTLWMENEREYTFDFPFEETARQVVKETMSQEECPYEVEVTLVLTDSEDIRCTNRNFRGIDSETDVLSFPAVDFSAPSDFQVVSENEDIFLNPDSNELILGDIMICVPRMRRQAKEYGHGEKREFAFLIAHSLLHLLGYDHMETEEAAQMEAKQEQVLQSLKINR
ncbi:MAG: rRNA maturation RNase YbeY [Ruminococcus sp.]|jgi:probable rRNA maturation factor